MPVGQNNLIQFTEAENRMLQSLLQDQIINPNLTAVGSASFIAMEAALAKLESAMGLDL